VQTYKAWQAVGIGGVGGEHFTPPNYNYDASATWQRIVMLNDPFFSGIDVSAMNKVEANCNISSINKPVVFSAGNEIRLLPGFVSNNDFHAYICDQTPTGASSHKSIGNNSEYYTNEDENKGNTKEMQTKKDAVIIYPNPNKGAFTVNTDINPQEVISVQVFSIVGQSIYKQDGLPNTIIQLPQPTSGVYYVEIITQKEKFIRKMVVN
jgi:hypothetical protein